MKIIRWLLSHTFLILLIVVVIYGYMYWGNLAGKDTPAGKAIAYLSDEFEVVDEFVVAVKEKHAQLYPEDKESLAGDTETSAPAGANDTSVEEPSAEQEAVAKSSVVSSIVTPNQPEAPTELTETSPEVVPVSTPSVATAESTAESETVVTKEPIGKSVEQTPVNISYRHNNMQVQQSNSGVVKKEVANEAETAETNKALMTSSQGKMSDNLAKSVEDGSNSAAADANGASAFVSPEIEKQLDNVDDHGKVIDPSLHNDEVKATWIKARKSYYQRNYALSEQSYQSVIDKTDDNYDAYGELGNVYFNQGKKQEAASAYYQAAVILVKKGQIRRAKSLIGLLKSLDKSKAEQLQKVIDSGLS